MEVVNQRISQKSFRLKKDLREKVDKQVRIAKLKRQLMKLPSHPEIQKLLKETHTLEWYVETGRTIEKIQQQKADLARAIELLNINPDIMFEPVSFLDFAILMALYYLQLHIIERVISGEVTFSKKVEVFIWRDKW